MKINPYQSFAPLPAKVEITLNVDRWNEFETAWSSPTTKRFSVNAMPITKQIYTGFGLAAKETSRQSDNFYETSSTTRDEFLGTKVIEGDFMRTATQSFTVSGFKPKEKLKLVFDGIEVTQIV